MKIKTFKGGYDENFSYLIINDKECCLLDLALPAKEIFDYIGENSLNLKFVIFMHSHFDHIVDLEVYRSRCVSIYGHESTKLNVDQRLKDEEIVNLGDVELKILHTPGHVYDAICILIENNLFTSDTLFVEGCGRVDLRGSEPEKMFETLQKLKKLNDNLVVYPGHDYGSSKTSTIAREKKNNKFLLMEKKEFIEVRTK